MYYYIVDPQKISQKEFERVQNILYSSLSEYRISGEVVRVTGLRTIQQLVDNAFTREVKTLVAVGCDETLHEVINAIGKRQIVLGYIPLSESELGETLGIKNISQAVKTIAFRRTQDLDLGLVSNPQYYFLSKLNFGLRENQNFRGLFNLPTFNLKFAAQDQFQATQKIIGGVIINTRPGNKEKSIGDPTDGLLDILLLPEISNWNSLMYRKKLLSYAYEEIPLSSVLHVKQIEISEPIGMGLKIGGKVIAKTPVTISVVPKALKMIVGKDRVF